MKYDITLKTLLQKAPRRLLQLLVNSQPQAILTVEYPSVKDRYPNLAQVGWAKCHLTTG